MNVIHMTIYRPINSILRFYEFLMEDLADPRTSNWFLVKQPIVFPLVAAYIYFIRNILTKYMKGREAFDLRRAVIVYNFLQICVSCYLFYECIVSGWTKTKSLRCCAVDFSNTTVAMREANGVHLYYMVKLTELLDTVFFVLRKKFTQITFLHLYHHSVMPMISWGATKYYPGGHGTFIGMTNSFVHIIMYTYYLLSSLGPRYRKYLWWKRYITTLQLLQFCVIFLHSMQLLFYDCGYPRWTTVIICPNGIFFYYLFLDFYKKSYPGKAVYPDKAEEKNGKLINGFEKNGVGHVKKVL